MLPQRSELKVGFQLLCYNGKRSKKKKKGEKRKKRAGIGIVEEGFNYKKLVLI